MTMVRFCIVSLPSSNNLSEKKRNPSHIQPQNSFIIKSPSHWHYSHTLPYLQPTINPPPSCSPFITFTTTTSTTTTTTTWDPFHQQSIERTGWGAALIQLFITRVNKVLPPAAAWREEQQESKCLVFRAQGFHHLRHVCQGLRGI